MFFGFFQKTKPVKKSGSKKLDKKISSVLNKSGDKCISCKSRKRNGGALWCNKCLKKMWSF